MSNVLLDRVDWPSVGDEVLYRRGSDGRWMPATVLRVAERHHSAPPLLRSLPWTKPAGLGYPSGSSARTVLPAPPSSPAPGQPR